MNYTYDIRLFNTITGDLTVDFHEFGWKSMAVPIDDQGLYISGAALTAYLDNYISESDKTRRTQIIAGIPNVQEIKDMLVILPPITFEEIRSMGFEIGEPTIFTTLGERDRVELQTLIQQVLAEMTAGTV